MAAAAPSRRSPTPISASAGSTRRCCSAGGCRSISRRRAAPITDTIAKPLGISLEAGGAWHPSDRQRQYEPRHPLGLGREGLRHRRLRALRVRRRRPAPRRRGGGRVRHPAACSFRANPEPSARAACSSPTSAPTMCAATSPTPAREAGRRCLALFEAMEEEAQAWLDREAVRAARRRFRRVARRPLSRPELRGEGRLRRAWRRTTSPRWSARSTQAHTQEYGYAIRIARSSSCRRASAGDRRGRKGAAGAGRGRRFARRRRHRRRRPVYVDRRARLARSNGLSSARRCPSATPFAGPAIVNEMSATTVILPGSERHASIHGAT